MDPPVIMPESEQSSPEEVCDEQKSSENLPPDIELWPILLSQSFYVAAIGCCGPAFPELMSGTVFAQGDRYKGGTALAFSCVLNGIFEFLSAGFLGELSDHYGRRPFLALASCGQVLDYLVAGLIANDSNYSFHIERGVVAVFVAKSVAGACGMFFIFARAYIADVSGPATSAVNFGKLGATVGISMILGPSLGQLVLAFTGRLRYLFYLAAVFNLLNIVLIKIAMKESLKANHRSSKVLWRNANPIGTIRFFFQGGRTFLMLFGAMCFVDAFSLHLFMTFLGTYLQAVYRFTIIEVGGLMTTFGVIMVISMLFVMRPLVRHVGELVTMRLGYLLSLGALLLLGSIFYIGNRRIGSLLIYPSIGVFAMGMISGPTQLSVASSYVAKEEQGKLQAANGCLDVIGKVAGPLIAAVVTMPAKRLGQPNIVFYVAALFLLPGVIIAFRLQRHLPKSTGKRSNGEDVPNLKV
jgi:DHA1 family tetracycline resistance protein-like MFS transporter